VDPPSGLAHSLATPSCGPADEPFTAIYLAAVPIESLQPPVPYVQVHVPESFAGLRAGLKWTVGESFPGGSAWLYSSASSPVAANGGEVGITGASEDAVVGYVDLRFSNGSRIRGTFDARRQSRQLLCG